MVGLFIYSQLFILSEEDVKLKRSFHETKLIFLDSLFQRFEKKSLPYDSVSHSYTNQNAIFEEKSILFYR